MLQKFVINNTEELNILLDIAEEDLFLEKQSIQVLKNLIKYIEYKFGDNFQKRIISVYKVDDESKDNYCYISIALFLFPQIEFRVFKDRAAIYINDKYYDYCMIWRDKKRNELTSREMDDLFSKFKIIIESMKEFD